MFKLNNSQQISLFDTTLNLTNRDQNFLKKSWCYTFGNKIFPLIDENMFRQLYSTVDSRPNTPVNVCAGALIIKEITGLTDDQLLESLIFDIRFQYALHTTSFKEQPISDKTLQRFRKRVALYEKETGIDLIHEMLESITPHLIELMDINRSIKRMDSFMIESNIKKLSRLELFYTCVADMVKFLNSSGNNELIDESLLHYLDKDDQNKVIYHSDDNYDDKMSQVLENTYILLTKCKNKNFKDVKQYQLLERLVDEQTIKDNNKNYELKDANDKTMNSKIMQSPYDEEATYRTKANKEHRGYVANVVEAGEKGNTLIDNYSLKENTYSDKKFMIDYIDGRDINADKEEIIADGAYYSKDVDELAKSKNVNIVPTSLKGRQTKDIYADFILSEDGKRILKCPNGNAPKSCRYDSKRETINARFNNKTCNKCPYKDKCNPTINSKSSRIRISSKQVERAKTQRKLQNDDTYKEKARYRNGIEAIPSIMRRKYKIDSMPIRGKTNTKI